MKSIWKDPVWSAVIAGGILAVGGAAGTFLLGWWPVIGRWFIDLWQFAGKPNRLANWLVWFLALLAIPTLLILAALTWAAVRPKGKVPSENWRTYTEDEFLGLRWRWTYFPSGNLKDPIPFCPACDYQVFPHHASAYNVIERIGFHCDSCGRDLQEFDESFDSLRSKVERFIQQKLRAGTWRSQNAN